MHFVTASVLSLCVAATLAAPARESRMNASQKALDDTVDRVLVDIPLSDAQVCQGDIGAPAKSLKFPHSIDIDESDVIRIEVDSESLRATKKDPACGNAFKRKKHHADEDNTDEADSQDIIVLLRKEESGLWSIKCVPPEIVTETSAEEVTEVAPEAPEDTPVEDTPVEESAETTEISEETAEAKSEVTTEVTRKLTTRVTLEVTKRMTKEGVAEEVSEETIQESSVETSEQVTEETSMKTSEQTPEENSEETSEGTSTEESASVKKRGIDPRDDGDDKISKRGVSVVEFDIEIV